MTHEQGNDTPLPERCPDGTEILFDLIGRNHTNSKAPTSSRDLILDVQRKIGEVGAEHTVLGILTAMDEKLDNFITEQQAANRKLTELLTELVSKKIG